MWRFFLEPALSVPLQMKPHGLSFEIQTMCGMSVWMQEQVSDLGGGRKREDMKVLR